MIFPVSGFLLPGEILTELLVILLFFLKSGLAAAVTARKFLML